MQKFLHVKPCQVWHDLTLLSVFFFAQLYLNKKYRHNKNKINIYKNIFDFIIN